MLHFVYFILHVGLIYHGVSHTHNTVACHLLIFVIVQEALGWEGEDTTLSTAFGASHI